MKINFTFLILLFISITGFAQDNDDIVTGTVLNAANDLPLENVNVMNLNQVKGTITMDDGHFELKATVNDTLFFSYLGFKTIRVRVTNDWLKYGVVKVKMTEIGIALEEVNIKPNKLTGYLEIDMKNIPIYENYRYSISGLQTGYEGGDHAPSASSKALGAIFNPADALYNLFGNKPKEMRKLRKMKEDEAIRTMLQNKFDRVTLAAFLQVTESDIEEILSRCNYSKDFMRTANDLQILDAINGCYEEYKVLRRD